MCVCVYVLRACSVMSNSLSLHCTVACQALLFMEFSRQEYWSGLPFPTAGDLPKPGTKPKSLASPAWQADSSPLMSTGKPQPLGA